MRGVRRCGGRMLDSYTVIHTVCVAPNNRQTYCAGEVVDRSSGAERVGVVWLVHIHVYTGVPGATRNGRRAAAQEIRGK